MIINQIPEQERPREKLLMLGSEALSDAELLAILIHKGAPGLSALELARELLARHGCLNRIFSLSYEELSQHRGLGLAKYSQLQAAVELCRRLSAERIRPKTSITHPTDAETLLAAKLRGCEQEVFACLFLDARHRVIRFEKLFYGSIKHAEVYPREVVKKALRYNAAAIIVAHNHPSGEATPSQADQDVTSTLVKALALVDIRLLDHFIVGDSEIVSLAALGLC